MKRILLKPNEEKRIARGHRWVFSNEIGSVEGSPLNGDTVLVYSSANKLLGTGFYNSNSLIAVRMLSRQAVDDIPALLAERIRFAGALRKQLFPERTAYRLVYAESDLLPGLIIDRYNDTYVLQIHCAGMDFYGREIADVLEEEFGAKHVFTANEPRFREYEGLPDEDFLFTGERGVETITDGVVKYKVKFENFQKTGMFFDQAANRVFAGRFCKGKNVLDAFCHSGGFGLNALANGATSVTFADASATALESVKENYKLNRMKAPVEYKEVDIFDFLEEYAEAGNAYDVTIVDPPAFVKSKKSLATGVKGYRRLNELAFRITNKGGLLVTSSCSSHVDWGTFLSMVHEASQRAAKGVQLLYSGEAGIDHPVLPIMPETSYLKFCIYRVL